MLFSSLVPISCSHPASSLWELEGLERLGGNRVCISCLCTSGGW